ncbi:MAG: hypothetical protein MJZ87_09680 [Bacteroidales bacterium]|nr:hypothetical protein [Bacteroidales bacterium]
MADQKNTKGKSVLSWLIWVASLIVLVIVVVMCVLHIKNDPQKKLEQEAAAVLDSLHIFPPMDFADSLYYRRVLISYEDESPRDVYFYEKDSLGNPTKNKVHETHYYPDNKKYVDGNVANDTRDGLWYAYHKDGKVQTMAHYEKGKEEGRYAVYYENGNVRYTGMYKHGKRVGVWYFYDENEKLVKTKDFDKK